MLLATSILSALVVGYVGNTSGKNSLQNAAFNQLTEVRESRSREITGFFDQLQNSLVLYTRGSTTTEAVQGFTAGFQELKNSTITPEQDTALEDYYGNVFVKGLQDNTGNTSDPKGSSRPTPLRGICRPTTPRRSPISTGPSSWTTQVTGLPRTRNITTTSARW